MTGFSRQLDHPTLVVAALGAMFLLMASPLRAGDSCAAHFPVLRAHVKSGRSSASLSAELRDALRRDLAIERALWQDEVARQRQRLQRSRAIGPDVVARLEVIDSQVRGRLDAVDEALRAGKALPIEATQKLLGCGAGRAAAASPYAVAPTLMAGSRSERLHRLPQSVQHSPEGYSSPPSEVLRAATRSPGSDKAAVAAGKMSDPVILKAEQLGVDPVAIYSFVLNEIRPVHYLGSAKGPAAVLRSGEGNDADQAALLAALFRAAGFPARVAWGVREIGPAALLSHFGAADTAHLERLMTAAGIPSEPVMKAGRPAAYRLERAWCEVWLPYANFRGVILDPGGATWLALDPQLKTMSERPQQQVLANLGIDSAVFVGDYLAGRFCTAPLDDPAACPLPSEVLAPLVDQHLGPGRGYHQASQPLAMQHLEEEVLPAGMVGQVISVIGFGLEFPDELCFRARLEARQGQRVLLEVETRVSELAGEEATLWYTPATAADEEIVTAYGHSLWMTPSYLVNARLELWAGGAMLAAGTEAIGMGREFDLDVTVIAPGGDSVVFRNPQLCGVPLGIGIAPGLQGHAPPGDEFATTAEALATLASEFLDGAAAFQQQAASLDGLTVVHPFPSVVTVASVVEPVGSLGIVERLAWKGIRVDADLLGARASGELAVERRWLDLTQLQASALERRIFESRGIAAVSADMAMILAADQGIPLLPIDQDNLASVLPGLPFDEAITSEIEGWVLAGGRAEIPARPLSHIAWTGVGYRLVDPASGETRYQLSGSLSGGMIAVPFLEIDDSLRGPLQYPAITDTNSNGDEAVAIRIFDGNLQVATVGQTLSDGDESASLKVIVSDSRGRPVRNAEVTFSIVGGGGSLAGRDTITVESGWGGLATTELTLGILTNDSPYYILFPEDEHATRAGVNLVTAKVNGYPLEDMFYELGAPDEVAWLAAPRGTRRAGLPHLSVAIPLTTVPVDKYGNPVSNQEVTYVLEEGVSGGPNEGPVLISPTERESCHPGPIVGKECGGSGEHTVSGSFSGVWVVIVIDDSRHGPKHVTATTRSETDEYTVRFSAEAWWDEVPSGEDVGDPLIVVSRRGQPTTYDGVSLEAYSPGAAAWPLQVSLFLIQENFTVVECGEVYCTRPAGTYTTRRFGSAASVHGCYPDSCGSGTLQERAEVTFGGIGEETTISEAGSDGFFTHTVRLPGEPGRYTVTASPRVWYARPRRPLDPDNPEEVVTCSGGGGVCGARLEVVELAARETEFVLWAVRGRIDDPVPIVNLGHESRNDSETAFRYVLEPADYPALDTTVYFLEDGAVVMRALSQGRGTGVAILPPGDIFANPGGLHEVGVAVNEHWWWTPGSGVTLPLLVDSGRVPFPIVMFDVDIDSDNTNGQGRPDRNQAEEDIEEDGGPHGFGRFVFVNHNNDNDEAPGAGDDRPDYAELEVQGEQSFVQLVVELRPEGGDWEGVEITFDYPGPTRDQLSDDAFAGELLGVKGDHTYRDYRAVKVGALRIWNVEDPEEARTLDDYLVPGVGRAATDLGFGDDSPERTFFVEGINGAGAGVEPTPTDINLQVAYADATTIETVRVTVLEPNLGVNNSNRALRDHSGDPIFLRPGVPDESFTIDDDDEIVEDQGDGFRFWRTPWLARLTMEMVEDLAPLVIEVPQVLLDEEYEFGLSLESTGEELVQVFPVPEGQLRLEHQRHVEAAEALLAMDAHRIPLTADLLSGPVTPRPVPVTRPSNELVFLAMMEWQVEHAPTETARLTLHTRPPDSEDWLPIDSVRLTFSDIDSFFPVYSARGDDTGHGANVFFDYPTENVDGDWKTVTGAHFPLPDGGQPLQGTGERDQDKDLYLVWLHGYNVPLDAALVWGRVAFKRLYWVGYRGNFLLFTWKGDPASTAMFGTSNRWALQTSETLRQFLFDTMRQQWQIDPNNITIIAHSLGNLVAYDAMRLHMAYPNFAGQPQGGILFNTLISSEAAVWAETMWPQAPVDYCPDGFDPPRCYPITYSVRELQCSSWTFWFNQTNQQAWRAVNRIFHSYSPGDNVLRFSMRMSDWAIRHPLQNSFDRPTCDPPDEFRVPWRPNELRYSNNPTLSFGDIYGDTRGCPAMLRLDRRANLYFHTDFNLPLGSAPHSLVSAPGQVGIVLNNLNALSVEWDAGGRLAPADGHSNCKDEVFPEIDDWWRELGNAGAVPIGREY